MLRKLKISVGLLIVAVFVCCGWSWVHRGVISSRGGVYFFKRVELPVPLVKQSDISWRYETLGNTPSTIGQEGCAIASATMVLNYYGFDTNPKILNEFLKANGGYTDRGWIYWEKAAELVPNKVEKAYEDLPSHFLIDSNLLAGNPVIVRLKRAQTGKTHFVVIVGKEGFDYLIADPGSGSGFGAGFRRYVYPLSELTSKIEALRFYKSLSS